MIGRCLADSDVKSDTIEIISKKTFMTVERGSTYGDGLKSWKKFSSVLPLASISKAIVLPA